ncbi:beta-lactamase family protein [Dactylosporangium sp. NBC_01737]|uniref:serine hydrolase domain-containing protein n=1 Tax=Dactylosporangium sp. NBC_01737 TaxID=2975959 RepID=UPI002E10F382|nr:beta-lactamase family protein [Dactylosporangium sp. NBC_01737]
MSQLAEAVDEVAGRTGFSGVVSVDRGGDVELVAAYGLADRAARVPNTPGTRFGIASGVKGMTAAVVMSLVEDGLLGLGTAARDVLGADLPLIGDAVTVEQLLAHRSGIGDYFDEDAGHDITEHVLPVPVHELLDTEDYLKVLGGHPAKFAPGTRFSYCNGGYVVLALIAERAAGVPFHELVTRRVCTPAGMAGTGFHRSDEPPPGLATGYLPIAGADRTNVFHLPVRGSGDGGISSTVADVSAFWRALTAGRILPAARVAEMLEPRSDVPGEQRRYGLGFWLPGTGPAVILEGYDAGVSFRSVHDPGTALTYTVVSNTSDGAWPVARRLGELLTS